MFHAGDGNLHPLICYDERIEGQSALAEKVAGEILIYCVEAGGSITGEHGVGADKKEFMPKMFSEDSLEVMQSVRDALDPKRCVTRAKSFPLQGSVVKCRVRIESILWNACWTRRTILMGVTQALRQGSLEDAVDGVVPPVVAVPESPEELAQILAAAALDNQLTVVRGGGSKIGWGRVAARVDLVIGTQKLDQLLAHRYGDMTVTAQAGMSLASLNRRLAEHGQYFRSRARSSRRLSAESSRPTMPDRCVIASGIRHVIC